MLLDVWDWNTKKRNRKKEWHTKLSVLVDSSHYVHQDHIYAKHNTYHMYKKKEKYLYKCK